MVLFRCHCTTCLFEDINSHSEVKEKVYGTGLAAPEMSSKLVLVILRSAFCMLIEDTH